MNSLTILAIVSIWSFELKLCKQIRTPSLPWGTVGEKIGLTAIFFSFKVLAKAFVFLTSPNLIILIGESKSEKCWLINWLKKFILEKELF